jgi:hypothetical protein
MEISPLTDSVAILILVYLVGVILFYVIASEISDSKLGGYVFLIIGVGNLFWTGRPCLYAICGTNGRIIRHQMATLIPFL